MSVLGTLARVGEGVATGGLSEAYRYATSAAQAPGLPGATQGTVGAKQVLDPATGQPTGQWVSATGQPLNRDPVTGNLTDPTTGNAYTSTGASVVNPTAAQQIAGANSTATSILANLPQQQQQQQAALDAQKGQIAGLDATINGTAPSAADTQLQQTLGQNTRQQLALAAGAGGENAFAARRAAAANIGNLNTQTAQAAGTQRAQEVATAQGLKSQALNAIAGNTQAATNQTLNAGQDFTSDALTGETSREGTQAGIDEKNTAASSALKGQVIGSIAGIGAKAAL